MNRKIMYETSKVESKKAASELEALLILSMLSPEWFPLCHCKGSSVTSANIFVLYATFIWNATYRSISRPGPWKAQNEV